jgi:hypothetical protein
MIGARLALTIAIALAVGLACGGPARPAPANPPSSGPARAGAALAITHGVATRSLGPITPEGLAELLTERFARQHTDGTFVAEWNGTTEDVLAELAAMGWSDLGDIARAIPPDFDTRAAIQFRLDDPANLPGLLRDFMIMSDPHRYFGQAWQDHWGSLARGDRQVYEAYGIDLEPIRAAGVMD